MNGRALLLGAIAVLATGCGGEGGGPEPSTLSTTSTLPAGDTATVTYDVMFGESAAYTSLTGEITNVDGTWTVSRPEFCSFMASARNACPAGDD